MLSILLGFCMLSVNMAFLYRGQSLINNMKTIRRSFSVNAAPSPPSPETTVVWPHRFSIAPMMDYTDRHQRYFQRLITNKAALYTEMVTCWALAHNQDNVDRFLRANFNHEDPLVLQLGGSDPVHMKTSMKIAVDFGYKEININCGCPSERVAGSGGFGAYLMREVALVAEMVEAMASVASNVPITIKCRIGVDNNDSYEELAEFIRKLSTQTNIQHFIIHARKAILNMHLSPAQNRQIPPLCYDVVYRLVKDFPHLDFTLNGGVKSYEEVLTHYSHGVKGVMVGRAAVDKSFYWRNVDSKLYNTSDPGFSRREILERYGDYCDQEEASGRKVNRYLLCKPVANLFESTSVSKTYKRNLDAASRSKTMSISRAFKEAIKDFPDAVLDLR